VHSLSAYFWWSDSCDDSSWLACPVPRAPCPCRVHSYMPIYVKQYRVQSSLQQFSEICPARPVREESSSRVNCACGMVRWCEIHHIDHDRSREPLPTKVARRQVRVGVALNPIFLRSSFSLLVLLLSCVVFLPLTTPLLFLLLSLTIPPRQRQGKGKGAGWCKGLSQHLASTS
jgi:hypothetical protein